MKLIFCYVSLQEQQEAKVIWQRLHRMQHTLHAQDSVAVAVPEICRQSQNLKVGHVTPPPTFYDLLLHSFC